MLLFSRLGFEVMQKLMEAESVDELDEAYRVLNNGYLILRGHLEVRDEIVAGNVRFRV